MATIGLRDIHYAILNSDNSSGVSYATPVRMAGAISANVNPNTNSATLFADDGPYDSAATMGQIEVEINLADIAPEAQAALLGHTYSHGLLIKKSSDQPPYVALGYRSLKSNGAYRHTWLYKGKFVDSEQNNQTKGDDIEYQTPTIKGSFVKRDYDDNWQIEADSDDSNISPVIIANWFDEVIDITSVRTLASIAITTAPTKTSYTEGETFSTVGMVVTATYDDASTAVVTNYTYTPNGALATTDTAVTVSYTEGGVTKTATQTITVAAG